MSDGILLASATGKPGEYQAKVHEIKDEALAAAERSRFVPAGRFIRVRPIKVEMRKGGVLLPNTESAREQILGCIFGEVLAIGPGDFNANGTRMTVDCKPGTVVAFQGEPAAVFPWGEEEVVLIHEQQVFGHAKQVLEQTDTNERFVEMPLQVPCGTKACKGLATLDTRASEYRCTCGWKMAAVPPEVADQ